MSEDNKKRDTKLNDEQLNGVSGGLDTPKPDNSLLDVVPGSGSIDFGDSHTK